MIWYEMVDKEQIAVWYEMLDKEQIIYLTYPAQAYRRALKNVWTIKSMIGEKQKEVVIIRNRYK